MSTVRAVLFDFGDTLVGFESHISEETVAHARKVIVRLIEEVNGGQSVLPELVAKALDRVGKLVSMSYRNGELEEQDLARLYDEAFRWAGFPVPPQLLPQIVATEHSAIFRHAVVPDSTLATLDQLRLFGYRIAVVSNTSWPAYLWWRGCHDLGLAPYVPIAALSSEVGLRKPHPRIYQHALDRLQLRPEACVFVGDRIREDIAGPQSVGMKAVLTHEFRQEYPTDVLPDAVIERLPELLKVLPDL